MTFNFVDCIVQTARQTSMLEEGIRIFFLMSIIWSYSITNFIYLTFREYIASLPTKPTSLMLWSQEEIDSMQTNSYIRFVFDNNNIVQ